mgnify:CR=1 FL=1
MGHPKKLIPYAGKDKYERHPNQGSPDGLNTFRRRRIRYMLDAGRPVSEIATKVGVDADVIQKFIEEVSL